MRTAQVCENALTVTGQVAQFTSRTLTGVLLPSQLDHNYSGQDRGYVHEAYFEVEREKWVVHETQSEHPD